MDCLREETVPVSGRSGAQRRPDGNSLKSECAGCEGTRDDVRVQSDVSSPFAHSG